jgi:hypothetical protein
LELFRLPTELSIQSQSQSYVTTDGQPASLSWNKAPTWGLRQDLYYCLTVAGLLVWGALSDERTGLPFAIATGLASAAIFGSESRGTRGHILLSQIRELSIIDVFSFYSLESDHSTENIRCLAMDVFELTEKTHRATPVVLLRACIAGVA